MRPFLCDEARRKGDDVSCGIIYIWIQLLPKKGKQ